MFFFGVLPFGLERAKIAEDLIKYDPQGVLVGLGTRVLSTQKQLGSHVARRTENVTRHGDARIIRRVLLNRLLRRCGPRSEFGEFLIEDPG